MKAYRLTPRELDYVCALLRHVGFKDIPEPAQMTARTKPNAVPVKIKFKALIIGDILVVDKPQQLKELLRHTSLEYDTLYDRIPYKETNKIPGAANWYYVS